MSWFKWFSKKKRTDLATTLMMQDLLDPGAKTASGIKVNNKSAMGYDPYWRGVQLIAADVSGLKMEIFRRVDDDGKEKAISHPSRRIIRRKPNPDMTWRTFAIQMQVEALIYGNAYAVIEHTNSGTVLRMDPVPAPDTAPVRSESGELFYRTTRFGRRLELEPRNVFHLRGISEVGDMGIHALNNARESIGVGLAAERHGGRFFKQYARPGTVLTHPEELDQEGMEAIRDSWKKGFTGENAHNVAVLFEGMTVSTVGGKNNESQFIELLNERRLAIANHLGVPPSALGYEGTRTSFASLEAERQSYLNNTLDPWLRAWEEEAWDKLLTPTQQSADSHVIEFNRRAIVRAALQERFGAYNTAILGGWWSPNEARAAENMPPIPGGDTYRQQAQMQPITDDPTNEEDDDEDNEGTDDNRRHLETILVQTVTRMMNRLKNQAKQGKDLNTNKNQDVFIESVEPVLRAMGLTGSNDLFYDITENFEQWKDIGGQQLKDKMLRSVMQSLEQRHRETLLDTPVSSMTEHLIPNSTSENGGLNGSSEEPLTVS